MAEWAKAMKDIQAQYVTQVKDQWKDDRATLSAPLNGEDGLDVLSQLDPDARSLYAVSIHAFPPQGAFRTISTLQFQGRFAIPVVVRANGLGRSVLLGVLLEAVGLAVDAYKRDVSLNGLVEGPGDPAVTVEEAVVVGSLAVQELKVHVERLR